MPKQSTSPSYLDLALSFAKIGFVSFGGFIAMMSIIERVVSEEKKWISSEQVIEAIALTNMLPGAMAINLVAYVGYQTKGIIGSLISVTCAILPSFIITIALTYIYLINGHLIEKSAFFDGITITIGVIVIQVIMKMTKGITLTITKTILIASSFFLFTIGNHFQIPFLPPIILILYALYSFLRSKINLRIEEINSYHAIKLLKKLVLPSAFIILSLVILHSIHINHMNVQIINNFSTLSLSIFGGGYVYIPVAQNLFVNHLHWVSKKEFIDFIAISQMTPGPIMISVSSIGYKIFGIIGSFIATISFFTIPCIIMIQVSKFMNSIVNSNGYKAALKGLKIGVIGMIISSINIIFTPIITMHSSNLIILAAYLTIFIITLIVLNKFKIPFALLIVINGTLTHLLGLLA